jgi:hypothetical protein
MRTYTFHGAVLAAALLLPACSSAEPTAEGADGETAVEELRALSSSEILGSIGYGETKSNVAYDESLTYRAFSFDAATGDEIQIDVRSDADARAWLTSSSFRTVKSNDNAGGRRDSRITHRITKAGTYYIVFREKNFEDAVFSVSLERTNGEPPPPPPPPPPPTNDPFDPASCSGPAHSNPASLFSPGGTKRDLGQSTVVWQSRECNPVTGCTPWTGQSSHFAGVNWAGPAELAVRGTGIDVNLYGTVRSNERTTSAHCRFNPGGALSCDNENYLGTQYMGLSGVMKQNCIRITGEAQYRNALNGQPTGSEYRVAMLVRF